MADETKVLGCIFSEATAAEVEFNIMDQTKNGFVIAEGILQEGNEINRNRRFYPTEELAAAVISPRTQELIKSGNFKGEAGHPTDTSIARQAKVDPTLEQVWYTKLWMDGNFVKGRFRGTNNELGRSFNEDLKCGQRPSFSLRAVGSLVNENGRMTVRRMQMITYDRVYFPSHSKAYTTNIVAMESVGAQPVQVKQYMIENSNYFVNHTKEINRLSESGNVVDTEKDIVTPLTQAEMSNYLVSESANIKMAIDTFGCLFESMTLNPDLNTVTMKNIYGDKVNLYLEHAIQREIIDGFSKL